MRFLVLIIAALAPLFSSLAQAQDLPGRVGRLAFIEGQVSLYHDPDAGWERARINYPVTSENSLWTDRGSRAEMRVSGISVRLAETTQLDFVRIDDDQIDAFVTQGAINVRVRHFDANQRLDFATPQARFRLAGVGRYRIDVDEQSDEATLTVFAGNAVLRSSRGNVQVRAGSALRVYGGSRSAYNFERASLTAFDRWSNARDERWQETRSSRYVSTYMTGYEDLDAYGDWREEPEFGALWFPTRVERDWAPYRYGRWENVRPWGWTWVDDAPWGYAPFHYGRWVYVRDRWAWSPGKREERPAWAPALVSWVGGSAAAGGGGPTVGWYPLSPWDRYQPWYNASPTYVNRVNIIVRSDAPRQDRQVWREASRVQGATVVRREQFSESRPMNQAAIRLAPEATRSLQAITPTQALPPPSEVRTRRAQTQAQQAPAPAPPVTAAPVAPRVSPQSPQGTPPQGTPPQGTLPQGAPAPAAPRGQPEGERGNRGNDRNRGNAPDFKRPQATPEPAPANPQAAKGVPGPAPGPKPATAAPEATRPTPAPATPPDAQRQQQEKAAREAQQQSEKAAREAQQQQEKAAREAQQQQEKAAREGQQQRDRQQQDKAARDAQQQQEKAAREGQQQRDRQQQDKAAREAQQQQEKAAREGQQQRDRQQQEKAARDAQQQQEKAARDAQQQQEKAARDAQQLKEKAAREAQQQQEKAARDAQQQRAAPPAPPAAPAAVPPAPAQPAATRPPQGQPQGKGKPDKDDEKDKEDKEKGRKN
jgi:hypothetical protein